MAETSLHIQRALISVSNKLNILEFAQKLLEHKIQLLASEGTAKILSKSGLEVTKISQYVNFPEIMNGRIKTLHAKIYAGVLARKKIDDCIMKKHSIQSIDMIIADFYPLNFPIKKNPKQHTQKDISIQEKLFIENIDIGGPSIVRAAAKNYENVVIIINKNDYTHIIKELNDNQGKISINTRLKLANKAFQYIATYDALLASYFKKMHNKKLLCNENKQSNIYLPNYINCMDIHFTKKQNMRYGENPHQTAAFYIETNNLKPGTVSNSTKLQGKQLSYNNILDIDIALECAKMFTKPTCVIVKHGTPCGVASNDNILQAYKKAYESDSTSAFGSIIAFNNTLNKITAQTIIENQFTEIIIAPRIEQDALKILTNKKNIRVLTCGNWRNQKKQHLINLDFKRVNGGLLVQNRDIHTIDKQNIKIVTKRYPTNQELNDALFCWKVVKFVKSNAIIYGRNEQTIGIGTGQTSRIDAAKIGAIKAKNEGFNLQNATMASDGFLPFPDTIDLADSYGITCIIQPGGGIKDNNVIAKANKYNITMIFTHIRHFRH